MAIAWSRISSKSIADPPCALRLVGNFVGDRRYRHGACVPQPAGKGKREVGGLTARRARNSEVSLLFLRRHEIRMLVFSRLCIRRPVFLSGVTLPRRVS